MNIVKIIEKKVANKELTTDELDWAFSEYSKGNVKDYQMSSLLMAILFNGMTENELYEYTKILINSGITIDFDDLEFRVDKHSTGGIGDKVSLILSPILAANGIKVGKISGRGLGFTGGTVDKLESIPNFSINLSLEEFKRISTTDGISLINTSDLFAPLDKIIYALRDVTGTVSSNYLIAASIMSKKLLVNSKYIFIDLKVGSAALFKTLEQAEKQAKLLKMLAQKFNREIYIMFSTMDQPLGTYIGNELEVFETVEILNNRLSNDALELVTHIASQIISKLKKISIEQAKKDIVETITSGKAYKKFVTWITNQNGDIDKFNSLNHFDTKYNYNIGAKTDGFLSFNNTVDFGYGLIELGGGRKNKEDELDFKVGFKVLKKTNDPVVKGDKLVEIYSNKELSEEFLANIESILKINDSKIKFKQILKELSW